MPSWFRADGMSRFPLAWERSLWSGRPGLARRLARPRDRYHLTDFRVVVTRGRRTVAELALHDLARIDLRQSWTQRVRGTTTLVLHPKSRGEPVTLADVRQARRLALVIELLATDPAGFGVDASFVADAIAPPSTRLVGRRGAAPVVAVAVTLVAGVAGLVASRGGPLTIDFPADDAIYPAGRKRNRTEIMAFMERDVMPFARAALGPIVGGADAVTCLTCHGQDAAAREWRMPAVSALPRPVVRQAAMERLGADVDAQLRNAVYGYLADDGRQGRMAHMRGVVMPGMARLLHRPAYDFTRSYAYNRARFAFGCYHCHLVSDAVGPPGTQPALVSPASGP